MRGADEEPDAPATKRPRGPSGHPDVPGGFTLVDKDGDSGRRKIRIEYISDKSRRHITFSKRKAGIMKKAYELSTLTGTQVLLLVVSETGLVYTFTTAKLQPLVTKPEGKNLIQVGRCSHRRNGDPANALYQACLNAPDGILPDGTPSGGPVPATKGKGGGLAIRPHKLTAAATAAMAASAAQQSMGSHQAEHAQQQTELHQQIGQGTPGRPKKRMPSGKLKKGQQLEMGLGGPDTLPPPPVPQIPDMHRNANSPHMMNALQSPLSAGHYIPPEYQQHQQQQQHPVQHQQPGPPYYQQPGDYNPAYYGPGPNAGGPQGNGHVHPQATQGQPQQQQQQQQPPPPQGYSYNISQEQLAYQRSQQEHARLMMDPRRNMGMGM